MEEVHEKDQVETLLQAAHELIEKEPHFQEREAQLTEILGLLLRAEELYSEMKDQCQGVEAETKD
jgi:hypothetical protein